MEKVRAMAATACVATLLAQAIGLGYLIVTGRLDRGTRARIVAVVHGLELALPDPISSDQAALDGTEISLKQRSEMIAKSDGHLDMRSQLIDSALNTLAIQRRTFAAEKKEFDEARSGFKDTLTKWETGKIADALDDETALIGKLQPDQAKAQLLIMFDDGEIDRVVTLWRKLPLDRQAKIAAEFTQKNDEKKLAEIIRRIHQGVPQIPLAERTRSALE